MQRSSKKIQSPKRTPKRNKKGWEVKRGKQEQGKQKNKETKKQVQTEKEKGNQDKKVSANREREGKSR